MRTAPLDFMGRPKVLVTAHTQWVGTPAAGHCAHCHATHYQTPCVPHWESVDSGQPDALHTAPRGVYQRAKSLAG